MSTDGVRGAFELWPIALSVVLCGLAVDSREYLPYGWIPGRLFWLAAAIGVSAVAVSRVPWKEATELSGYMKVLFGSIVCVSLTDATMARFELKHRSGCAASSHPRDEHTKRMACPRNELLNARGTT